MAFTYNLNDATDTSSQMRLEIGDMRVDPNGILPEGRNFQDNELDWFFTQEGSLRGAVARTFEAASAEWAKYPEELQLGPERQKVPASVYFAQRAQYIRDEIIRRGSGGVGSRAVTRADGYSDDVDNVTQ